MHLIQILLPTKDNQGSPYTDEPFAALNRRLLAKFGGVTAYTRSPARGKWLNQGEEERDDIVILEVMVEALDRTWWSDLRASLESALQQEEIIIRCQPMEQL